jgi:hypothetical protein
MKSLLALGAGIAVVAAMTPAHAQERPPVQERPAASSFNATILSYAANTPLVALPPSMTLNIDAVNLPGTVGLYALHCEVPANPRSAPTNCDAGAGTLQYFPASGTDRPSLVMPLKVNAEFYGANPNPTDGVTPPPSLVDCRATSGDPRAPKCGIYVLGAGREAANPAYLRFWPTAFSPITKERRAQQATVQVAGKRYAPNTSLVKDRATPFQVRLSSGLTPDLTSDNCQIGDGTITALQSTGQCTVTITSSGGANVRPFLRTLTFNLR